MQSIACLSFSAVHAKKTDYFILFIQELSSESDREKARMLEEQLESRDEKIQSLESEVVAMKVSLRLMMTV